MASVDPVASTAQWMAADRARESARPDRLFDDPLADLLAGPEGVDLMGRMEAGIPASPTLPIRTRFFDEALGRLLVSHRVAQVVLVAAGMDARAFRLELPDGVTMFEVDRPEVLELKAARLAETSARPRCRRVTVAADLTGEWDAALTDAGFDPHRAAVFLAEGLLAYLDQSQVERLLDLLASLGAAGSFLLADLPGLDARRALQQPWLRSLDDAGMGWRFGTDDPEALFAAHGWEATATQYGDDGDDFGRWPWPRVDRHDADWPHSFLLVAERRR